MATQIFDDVDILFHNPFSAAFFRNSKEAIREAVNGLLERGIPVTYMNDGKIFREYSDGSIEELG